MAKKFDNKSTRYFTAFKYKDQDGKAPKLGILSEELMSYYRQVSATIANGFEEDDPSVKSEFLNNVFLALKDEGIQVSQNQTVSRILENLFHYSAPTHLRGLFGQFCKELNLVSFDRFASHVFQALIEYLPVMYDDQEDEDKDMHLRTSLNQLCQFMESHMRDVMTHTYGSHVLRSLLEVLGGVSVKDEIVRSFISRNQNIEKEIVFSQQLSEDYYDWFVNLKDKIIKFCNYEDHLSDNNYCPVLQTVLLILYKVNSAEYTDLASTIISKACPPVVTVSDVEDVTQRLPLLVQSEVGSYLMELLISLASETQVKSLYDDLFKGKIIYYSVHPIANYVLQRMILTITDKEMFLELLDETNQYLEDILALNHLHIVKNLAQACRQNNLGQEKMLTALASAFHCNDSTEKQEKIVPLVATLQTYDVMFPPAEKQGKKSGILNTVILHGSLILQQLFHFKNTRTLVNSLLQLSPAELSFLCSHKSGSHVIDEFFLSTTVRERSKDEFLKKLQGMYVSIACTRNGSRCLESIWKGSSMKRKILIAEELLKGQEQIESDHWGHFLYKNFALFKFSQRRKEWVDIQNGIFKKQQLLQNILDGKGEKRKKKKRKETKEHQREVDPEGTNQSEEKISNLAEEKGQDDFVQTKKSRKRKAEENDEKGERSNETIKVKKKKKKEKKHDTDSGIENTTILTTAGNKSDSEADSKKKRKRKKEKKRVVRGDK